MSSTVTGWPRLGRRAGGRAEGRTGQLRPAAHRRDPETPRRAWSVVVVGRVPGDSTEIGGALSWLEEAAPAAGRGGGRAGPRRRAVRAARSESQPRRPAARRQSRQTGPSGEQRARAVARERGEGPAGRPRLRPPAEPP